MEVIEENFESELVGLERALRECDFLCIDGEFSGLASNGRENQMMLYDTEEIVYHKAKRNVGRFAMIQFGLCTFKFCNVNKCFVYRSYSCYVYNRLPTEFEGINLYDTSNTFQWQSLQLLAEHGFDFNKWILHGVGFLRPCDVERYKAELLRMEQVKNELRIEQRKQDKAPKVTPQQRSTVTRIVEKVNAFLKKTISDNELVNGHLVIEALRRMDLRPMLEILEHRFRDKIYVETVFAGRQSNCTLHVYRCNSETERKELMDKDLNRKFDSLKKAIGFCRLIELLTEAKKPIIGHNLMLDLMHLSKSFCFDLPNRLEKFNQQFLRLFPYVIDTKTMCTLPPFKTVLLGCQTSLGELLPVVLETPFPHDVILKADRPEYGYETGSGLKHDAGFDAYTTGKVFLQMAVFFARFSCEDKTTLTVPMENLVDKFANKLTIPGFVQDIPFLSLKCASGSHSRPTVFVVTFTDGEYWKIDQVRKLFRQYGETNNIRFINDRKCYVTVESQEMAQKVRNAMETNDGRLCLNEKTGGAGQFATVQMIDDYNRQVLQTFCSSSSSIDLVDDKQPVEKMDD